MDSLQSSQENYFYQRTLNKKIIVNWRSNLWTHNTVVVVVVVVIGRRKYKSTVSVIKCALELINKYIDFSLQFMSIAHTLNTTRIRCIIKCINLYKSTDEVDHILYQISSKHYSKIVSVV